MSIEGVVEEFGGEVEADVDGEAGDELLVDGALALDPATGAPMTREQRRSRRKREIRMSEAEVDALTLALSSHP